MFSWSTCLSRGYVERQQGDLELALAPVVPELLGRRARQVVGRVVVPDGKVPAVVAEAQTERCIRGSLFHE